MTQYVVSLLAERPEDELRAIHEKARAEVARLQVEIDQIEQALAKQAQQQARRSPRPSRRKTASGGTRERVLEAVRGADDTISAAQIIAALRESGSSVTSGAIRNMVRRLVDDGEIVRIREGAYKLTSRNGSDAEPTSGPTENGAHVPLSTVAVAPEGAT
jgi:hypothetical protein